MQNSRYLTAYSRSAQIPLTAHSCAFYRQISRDHCTAPVVAAHHSSLYRLAANNVSILPVPSDPFWRHSILGFLLERWKSCMVHLLSTRKAEDRLVFTSRFTELYRSIVHSLFDAPSPDLCLRSSEIKPEQVLNGSEEGVTIRIPNMTSERWVEDHEWSWATVHIRGASESRNSTAIEKASPR